MQPKHHRLIERALLIAGSAAIAASLAYTADVAGQTGEVKDPNPPSGLQGVAARATGGPDAFGYTYADQSEATCPTQFIDITGTGTPVTSGDDVGAPVALTGPAFNFYGTDYTSLAMTTNGYLSTDPTDSGPDLSNDCPLPAVPSTPGGTNGARIYPLHDDLISDGLFEYFASCPRPGDYGAPEGCYVFQWDNVTHFGGGGPWTMEAVLYDTSYEIVYQIGAGNPETGMGSTTGIQDPSPPTTGLTYACDTAASVPDNTTVCIYHPMFPPGTFSIPTLSRAMLPALAGLLILVAGLSMRRRRLQA